jgi:hypothetical protein
VAPVKDPDFAVRFIRNLDRTQLARHFVMVGGDRPEKAWNVYASISILPLFKIT